MFHCFLCAQHARKVVILECADHGFICVSEKLLVPLFRTALPSGLCYHGVSSWLRMGTEFGPEAGACVPWLRVALVNSTCSDFGLGFDGIKTHNGTPHTRNVGCVDTAWGLWTCGNRLVSFFCGLWLPISCLRAPVWPGAGLDKSAIWRGIARIAPKSPKELGQ
jgi:hypothetical protein